MTIWFDGYLENQGILFITLHGTLHGFSHSLACRCAPAVQFLLRGCKWEFFLHSSSPTSLVVGPASSMSVHVPVPVSWKRLWLGTKWEFSLVVAFAFLGCLLVNRRTPAPSLSRDAQPLTERQATFISVPFRVRGVCAQPPTAPTPTNHAILGFSFSRTVSIVVVVVLRA